MSNPNTPPPVGQSRPTEHDHAVLRYIAQGHTNKEIAKACYRSTNGVATHIRDLMTRYGVHSRAQLAVEAVRCGAIVVEVTL